MGSLPRNLYRSNQYSSHDYYFVILSWYEIKDSVAPSLFTTGIQEVLPSPVDGSGGGRLQGLRHLRRQPAGLHGVLWTHEQQVTHSITFSLGKGLKV